MRQSLSVQGIDVGFVVINAFNAEAERGLLVDVTAYSLLQDTESPGSGVAWDALSGRKDDIFLFHSDGTLARSLPFDGELSTNLSTDEGYRNVRDAVLAVVNEEAPAP